LTRGDAKAQELYETVYCARGEMENGSEAGRRALINGAVAAGGFAGGHR
jgi:hypothetical protein